MISRNNRRNLHLCKSISPILDHGRLDLWRFRRLFPDLAFVIDNNNFNNRQNLDLRNRRPLKLLLSMTKVRSGTAAGTGFATTDPGAVIEDGGEIKENPPKPPQIQAAVIEDGAEIEPERQPPQMQAAVMEDGAEIEEEEQSPQPPPNSPVVAGYRLRPRTTESRSNYRLVWPNFCDSSTGLINQKTKVQAIVTASEDPVIAGPDAQPSSSMPLPARPDAQQQQHEDPVIASPDSQPSSPIPLPARPDAQQQQHEDPVIARPDSQPSSPMPLPVTGLQQQREQAVGILEADLRRERLNLIGTRSPLYVAAAMEIVLNILIEEMLLDGDYLVALSTLEISYYRQMSERWGGQGVIAHMSVFSVLRLSET